MNWPNGNCCCDGTQDDAMSQSLRDALSQILKEVAKKDMEHILQYVEKPKKEEPAMQVSYNGFTGELMKLARYERLNKYDLSIYDGEKKVTHSFTNVDLSDVKFSGGAVSFGA